jgi:hypothetical protein
MEGSENEDCFCNIQSFLFERFLSGIENTFTDFLFIVTLFGDGIEH